MPCGRICERLDGLPLAVELAAARAAVFTPRAMERAADGTARPTRGPSGTCPSGSGRCEPSIDWSYQLLEPVEQELFAAMSAFRRWRAG